MDQPKALLFDLDGVLIDSEPLHGQAWKETSSYFDLDLNSQQIELLQGRRRVDCAHQIIEWISKPIKINEILEIHKPISRKLIKKATAMPGSEDLIIWCYKHNIPIALVTSSSRESFELKSAPHEWLKLFTTKVLGDDKELLRGKPFPEPYLLAAEKLSLDATECWAIEDSVSGSTSALEAGCKVWLLKSNTKGIDKKNIKFSTNKMIEVTGLSTILKELKSAINQ